MFYKGKVFVFLVVVLVCVCILFIVNIKFVEDGKVL